MTSDNTLPILPTTHLMWVRPGPPGQFTAEVVGLPEIRATAATKDQAVEEVRQLVKEWLASGQLVPVEPAGNPLMQWFGHDKEDPDSHGYLEEIRRYRQEVDGRPSTETSEPSCSDSSSTPTT